MKKPEARHSRLARRAKAIDAEVRAGRWLADGNVARDAGKSEKAERCYRKAQYWLDRYNKLTWRA